MDMDVSVLLENPDVVHPGNPKVPKAPILSCSCRSSLSNPTGAGSVSQRGLGESVFIREPHQSRKPESAKA